MTDFNNNTWLWVILIVIIILLFFSFIQNRNVDYFTPPNNWVTPTNKVVVPPNCENNNCNIFNGNFSPNNFQTMTTDTPTYFPHGYNIRATCFDKPYNGPLP
jgi:hypothetical protein